jgi:hypothetical protein
MRGPAFRHGSISVDRVGSVSRIQQQPLASYQHVCMASDRLVDPLFANVRLPTWRKGHLHMHKSGWTGTLQRLKTIFFYS